jgi:hypothetical protein
MAGWKPNIFPGFKLISHSLIQLNREDGNPVVVIQGAAFAYRINDSRTWIGWSTLSCAKCRNRVVKHVRFPALGAGPLPQNKFPGKPSSGSKNPPERTAANP